MSVIARVYGEIIRAIDAYGNAPRIWYVSQADFDAMRPEWAAMELRPDGVQRDKYGRPFIAGIPIEVDHTDVPLPGRGFGV